MDLKPFSNRRSKKVITKLLFMVISGLVGIVVITFFAVFLFQKTPQTTHISHTNALLLHGYWLSQKDNGPVSLSLRSEMEVKAAYLLYKNNKTEYLVITAGPIWGNTYPPLGVIMTQRLMQLGVPTSKIILIPTAMDTYEEIHVFLTTARQHHWQSLGDLAAFRHDLTIPQLFATQHASAIYLSVEQVLTQMGDRSDQKMVQNIAHSIYDLGFGLYEFCVRVILFVDPRYQLLGNHARSTRTHKASYGGIFFIPIDKYNL